jgi:branched-chain amino acid transport system substrate-binding protein
MSISSPTRRRALAALSAAVVLTAALAACSGGGSSTPSVSPASGDPILVGFINQQAGSAANLERVTAGAQAAVSYINEQLGGVDGHPIKLDVCATDSTPAATQKCAQQMVTDKPLFVQLGVDNNMNVAYPILQAAGIPVLGGTPSTSPDLTATDARYWVGGVVSVIAGGAEFIQQYMPKVKKAGMLVFNLPSGQAAIPFFQKPLEAAGVQVEVNQVPVTATDMLSPYTALKDAGVDVIYAVLTAQQCAALASATQSQNNTIPIMVQPGCYTPDTVTQAGGAMNDWIVPMYGPDPHGDDDQAALFRDQMAQYQPDASVDTYSMVAFGEMMTVYENILKPLGYDKALTADLLKTADDSEGTAFLGSSYDCGQNSTFPSVCSFSSRWYSIQDEQGTLKDMTDGNYVDAGPALAAVK